MDCPALRDRDLVLPEPPAECWGLCCVACFVVVEGEVLRALFRSSDSSSFLNRSGEVCRKQCCEDQEGRRRAVLHRQVWQGPAP
jgi:hypothetical protein